MTVSRWNLRLEARLADFSIDVDVTSDERVLGIFGPSGCGKTSLLELIAGWRQPAAGRISIAGRTLFDSRERIDVATSDRGIGYVPQDTLLFPHMSVEANIHAGRRRADAPSEPASTVDHVLDVLDIRGLLPRDVRGLSGGESRRVALARALLSGPEVLLLDEPLGALDRPLRRRILPYLVRIKEEFDVPTLLVSHDPTEVRMLCDEVVVVEDGRSVETGPPSSVLLRRAEGYENVLRGPVVTITGDTARVDLGGGELLSVPSEGLDAGMETHVVLAPEDIILALAKPHGLSARNVLRAAVVDLVETSSGHLMTRVAVTGQRDPLGVAITHAAADELGLTAGREVFLIIKTMSCHPTPSPAVSS